MFPIRFTCNSKWLPPKFRSTQKQINNNVGSLSLFPNCCHLILKRQRYKGDVSWLAQYTEGSLFQPITWTTNLTKQYWYDFPPTLTLLILYWILGSKWLKSSPSFTARFFPLSCRVPEKQQCRCRMSVMCRWSRANVHMIYNWQGSKTTYFLVHIAFVNESNNYFRKVLVIFAVPFAKLFVDVCEKRLPRRAAALGQIPADSEGCGRGPGPGRIVKAWMNSVLFHWMPIRNWRFACSITYKCPGGEWGSGRIFFKTEIGMVIRKWRSIHVRI